jgi:glycosyltransferase involved in cell wall biosynthesis
MTSDNPKITILLATFNRAHLIRETLDSIIAQTYINWECLIVDDHSKDETEEVIGAYLENDNRFEYYKKTDRYKRGLSGTRNYGLDLAAERNAEFIQFFDDDDIMHPKKLEMQIKPLLRDNSLDLSICCYRKFNDIETIEFDLNKANDHSCHIRTQNLLKAFYLNQVNLNSPGPLWKAEILTDYRFNEELYYAEERDFYLRIFLNEELRYYPVEEILFWYRKHDKAITSNLYEDKDLKALSNEKFIKSFFFTVLKSKDPPIFILKSYSKIFTRRGNKQLIQVLRDFLNKNKNSNLKYWLLLIYLQFICREEKSY